MIEVLIWQRRAEKGLSLRELAERSGLSKSTLHRLECAVKSPTLAQLEQIADALGVDFFQLFARVCPRGGTN